MTAKIDRNGLHALLWSRRSRMDTLVIDQGTLADELTITKFAVNRILKEFEQDERLRSLSASRGHTKTYQVFDPRPWIAESTDAR